MTSHFTDGQYFGYGLLSVYTTALAVYALYRRTRRHRTRRRQQVYRTHVRTVRTPHLYDWETDRG